MLNKLREATKDLHTAIEKDNLAGKIISHHISLEEYKLLLLQNYTAYAAAEKEIQKFIPEHSSEKTIQLKKDLENLQVDFSEIQDFKTAFKCENYYESLGAKYVVDGSALGGMIIAKNLPKCPNLSSIEKPLFFSGSKEPLKDWKIFCEGLKNLECNSLEENKLLTKAKETFLLFDEVFKKIKLPAVSIE